MTRNLVTFLVIILNLVHQFTLALCFGFTVYDVRHLRAADAFRTTGATSLIEDDGEIILVGTKDGKIFRCHIANTTVWSELSGYDSKYPIYSMAKCRGSTPMLFCGGGDRYVSVWKKESELWGFVQRLGPHTGWVKGLQFDEEHGRLYSIGCNCVETWELRDFRLNHLNTRSIENSPTMGCTLSSDLLCLSLLHDGYLVAGGVDGRIHLWSPDFRLNNVLHSIRVHDGRVVALAYAADAELLFSTGHDGRLHATKFVSGCLIPDGNLSLEGNPRLTTVAVVQDTTKTVDLVLGTVDGRVAFVNAEKDDSGTKLRLKSSFNMETKGSIHAVLTMTKLEGREKYSILVGHANGLSILQIETKASLV